MKKVALITGGSSGIGKGIKNMLKKENWNVLDFSLEKGFDVSRLQDWIKIADKIQKKYKKLDLLVNNAGIHEKKCFQNLSIKEFEKVLKVNLFGAFYGIKIMYPLLLKSKDPLIINISSIVFWRGSMSGGVGYVSSKAGILGLTRQLSLELAPKIRVNAIAPGYIDTKMLNHLSKKEKKEIANMIPLKRIGKPKDIALAVKFLIESRFITGQVIHINGGLIFG